tara:strand:- start:1219 stop:2013 length:795 start_codon:yes stop_codon:yes gene_type:complete
MQKTVFIYRRPNTTNLPNDLYVDAKRRLGSVYLKGGDILKGLTIAEQKKWMPELLGISHTEAGWAKEVRKYFANLTVDVPAEGVTLNIAVDEEGNPINVGDYVKFRFAQAHPHVSDNPEGNKGRYFISDPQKVEAEKVSDTRVRKDAYKQLILLSDDEEKGIVVLKASGKRTEGLTAQQIEIALEDLLEADHKEFIRVCTDKNVETVAFIWDCVEAGVLRKAGNTFLFGDEAIGDDMDGAIRFLNLKKNSSMLLDIKAKLKAFS